MGLQKEPPYERPSYDVKDLSGALVPRIAGRTPAEMWFYTGVQGPAVGSRQWGWRRFRSNRIGHLIDQGVRVYLGRISPGVGTTAQMPA